MRKRGSGAHVGHVRPPVRVLEKPLLELLPELCERWRRAGSPPPQTRHRRRMSKLTRTAPRMPRRRHHTAPPGVEESRSGRFRDGDVDLPSLSYGISSATPRALLGADLETVSGPMPARDGERRVETPRRTSCCRSAVRRSRRGGWLRWAAPGRNGRDASCSSASRRPRPGAGGCAAAAPGRGASGRGLRAAAWVRSPRPSRPVRGAARARLHGDRSSRGILGGRSENGPGRRAE